MAELASFLAPGTDGRMVDLSQYAGKVLLIVNIATKCGFTPQLRGLEELHRTYPPTDFAVLGFPCNQFLSQSPGTGEEIADFCAERYQVTFRVFDTIDVNGPATPPLFEWLKSGAPGVLGSSAIKWNFTKFLVDRTGQPVVRYAPTMDPKNIGVTIERLMRQ